MNQLSQKDTELFYDTFRLLLQFSNIRFHVDDQADFANDEALNAERCKEAADHIWEKPALIDDFLRENTVTEEQKELLLSWKNCVQDMFMIERHLKNGSIFIGSNEKVYQVLGLADSIEDVFWGASLPVVVKVTLLPFRDLIISDGLYGVLPINVGPGIKSHIKDIYMQAKNENRIIRQLPEPVLERADSKESEGKTKKKAATKKTSQSNRKPVEVYHLKVYPKGEGRSVYRKIEICGNATLEKLCSVILQAFDFDEAHMYEFIMDNRMYSWDTYQSDPEFGDRSAKVRLDKMCLVPKQKFTLHYDFGDDWMFVINVEHITETTQRFQPKVVQSRGSISQYGDDDEDEYYNEFGDEYEDDGYEDEW